MIGREMDKFNLKILFDANLSKKKNLSTAYHFYQAMFRLGREFGKNMHTKFPPLSYHVAAGVQIKNICCIIYKKSL